MKKASKLQLFITMVITGLGAVPIAAQTTAFTYQGNLTEAGNPANGTYDMQFKLFDTAAVGTGTQQGGTINNPTVQVTAGSFSITLDFGANVFNGSARFLEIGVRPAGSPNPHIILAPRQAINSAPYAIQTVNATQLGGLPANRYIATDAIGNVGIGTSGPTTRLDVVNSTSQLRFGPSTADNGGYLTSTNPSQAIIAGGAKWDGANWIARDTAASLTAHQNGVIQFFTNSNLSVGSPFSPTARMHIDTNGFVGIGTTLPEQPVHVHGGKILLTGSDAAFTFRDRNSGSSADDWALYATGGKARLYNNSIGDVLAVTTNGNVGIGTQTPGFRLDVIGGVRSLDSVSTHFVSETSGGTNSWARVFMRTPEQGWFIGTSRGFNGNQFYIWDETANQIRMAINTNGYVSIGTTTPGARLYVEAATSETGVRGTSPDGTGVSGASTNNFGVSGYSANNIGVHGATGNPASYAGYFAGNVHVSGTVTQGSDARLKQNISKLGYGLSEVLRLRPVSWRWKAHPESGPQLGLVAQGVEPVLPELVSTDKDAEQLKGLNYTGLIPVLVNAIQEQQARIEEQSRQLKQQQTEIERQQREIAELRQAVKARKSSLHNHLRK